jgi:hypothetical protein
VSLESEDDECSGEDQGDDQPVDHAPGCSAVPVHAWSSAVRAFRALVSLIPASMGVPGVSSFCSVMGMQLASRL